MFKGKKLLATTLTLSMLMTTALGCGVTEKQHCRYTAGHRKGTDGSRRGKSRKFRERRQ